MVRRTLFADNTIRAIKMVSNLRLYCIRLGSAVVILGGGGHKPKTIRTLQDDTKLTEI